MLVTKGEDEMSLNKNTLKNELLNALQSYPSTAYEGAVKIANAYHTYSLEALDPMGGIPSNLDTKLPTLISDLNAIFSVLSLEIGDKISQLVTAFSNYWTGVIFIVSAPPTGQSVVSRLDGIGNLTSDLYTILTDLDVNKTFEDKAEELATALDNFTKKVWVSGTLNTTPNPTPYQGYIS
jgi:hypothetical protein